MYSLFLFSSLIPAIAWNCDHYLGDEKVLEEFYGKQYEKRWHNDKILRKFLNFTTNREIRRILLRRLIIFNRNNHYEFFYFGNVEESLNRIIITIKKNSLSYSSQNKISKENPDRWKLWKEAEETIHSWVKTYGSYEKDFNDLIEEVASAKHQIALINDFLKKDVKYPTRIHFKEIQNGKMVDRFFNATSKDKLITEKALLKKKYNDILGGYVFNMGDISGRELEQALLYNKLNIFREEALDAIENKDMTNEFKELYQQVAELLDNPNLKPSDASIGRVEISEIASEFYASFTMKLKLRKFFEDPRGRYRFFKELSPEDIEHYGFDSISRIARFIGQGFAFKAAGSLVLGGSFFVALWKFKLRPDYFNRKECIEKLNPLSKKNGFKVDQKGFENCFYEYLLHRFPKEFVKTYKENDFQPFETSNPQYLKYMEKIEKFATEKNKWLKRWEDHQKILSKALYDMDRKAMSLQQIDTTLQEEQKNSLPTDSLPVQSN